MPPVFDLEVKATARIKQVFEINIKRKVFKPVAGCEVLKGTVEQGSMIRVKRGEEVIFTGKKGSSIDSLRVFKDTGRSPRLTRSQGSAPGHGLRYWPQGVPGVPGWRPHRNLCATSEASHVECWARLSTHLQKTKTLILSSQPMTGSGRPNISQHFSLRHKLLPFISLNQQLLNFILKVFDLLLQLATVIGGDRGGDDLPGHATSASQSLLGTHKNVRNILILTKQGQVHQNLDGLCVGGQNDELGLTAVQGLCG